MLHEYLYKLPKEDHARWMADRSYDLQGLDKWINEQFCIGQLHVALRNILHDVPKLLGKRWICLTADLKTFQFNAGQWITNQHVIEQLNAKIPLKFSLEVIIVNYFFYANYSTRQGRLNILVD